MEEQVNVSSIVQQVITSIINLLGLEDGSCIPVAIYSWPSFCTSKAFVVGPDFITLQETISFLETGL